MTLPHPLPRILKAGEIVATVQRLVVHEKLIQSSIVASVTPFTACYENVIGPLMEVENEIHGVKSMITLLLKVSWDKETRDEAEKAQRLLAEETQEIALRSRDAFLLLISAVKERHEHPDVETKKLIGELLNEYGQSGSIPLEESQLHEYAERAQKISRLCDDFSRNLREEGGGGIWLTADELGGVLNEDLASFTQGQEFPHVGDYFVSFRWSNYHTVMRCAKSEVTRKRLFVANSRRLPEQVVIFKEVVLLRDENARLLGYKSHADFKMKERIAKSTEWVNSFLSQLKGSLGSSVQRDIELLKARKRQYSVDHREILENPIEILPWDFDFYTRLAEEDLCLRQSSIAEYFPLSNTISAVLNLFASFFRLDFCRILAEELANSIWHPDVEVWGVWDQVDEVNTPFLGYLYLDLLHRPNKHNCEMNITLASVKTFFHELGHAIHDLLGKSKYARFSGANASRDFVETPSLMLEEFCWTKETLQEISCHYTHLDSQFMKEWKDNNIGLALPSEKIPDTLLDPLIKSRGINRAWKKASGLATSIFDMEIHNPTTHEDLCDLHITSLYHKIHEELTLLHNPESDKGHPYVHHNHLMNNYDAGYYSYICSQAFADDIFTTTFADSPRSQNAWMRYRRGILESGGTRNELDMLEEFLGRPVNPLAVGGSLALSHN